MAAQAIAQSKGGAVSLNKIADGGSLPSHGSSNPDTTSGFYLSNGTERGFFDYSASMNDVSEFLVGSPVYDLAHGYAKNRLDAKVRRDQAFDDGIVSGIHNFNAGRAQRIANMSGFSADYMTSEQWQGIASHQYSKWNRELQSDVMGLVVNIAAAPSMIMGANWGVRGLIGLSRAAGGSYAQIGRSIGAYGWQQSAVNGFNAVVPQTTTVGFRMMGQSITNGLRNLNPQNIGRSLMSINPQTYGHTLLRGSSHRLSPTALEAGLNKSAATLARTAFEKGVILHGANGLVSGSANLGVDYLFNGSNKDFSHYAKTFASGFVGGIVGSAATFGVATLAAKRGASTLAATLSGEMIGGAVGGFVGKGIDNYIKDNSHDLAGYAYAMSASSLAGTGVAIVSPKWGKYTQFGFTSATPGTLENVYNNISTSIHDWWNR